MRCLASVCRMTLINSRFTAISKQRAEWNPSVQAAAAATATVAARILLKFLQLQQQMMASHALQPKHAGMIPSLKLLHTNQPSHTLISTLSLSTCRLWLQRVSQHSNAQQQRELSSDTPPLSCLTLPRFPPQAVPPDILSLQINPIIQQLTRIPFFPLPASPPPLHYLFKTAPPSL